MGTAYLVTGAGGFVGRNLVSAIRKSDPEAIVDALPRTVDLADRDAVLSAFGTDLPYDYIYHLADKSGNHRWAAANAFDQFAVNARIHLNVLEAWQRYQPQANFLFASSVWAYPEGISIAREADYWAGPLHHEVGHYGYTKKLVDVGIRAARQQYGLAGTTLVLGTCYGPGDKSDHLIPTIIKRMQDNPNELIIYGTGDESRDFVFIEDQVAAMLQYKDAPTDILNISSGRLTTIREVAETAVKVSGYKGVIKYVNPNGNSPTNLIRGLNVSQAEAILPAGKCIRFRPIQDGLRLTIG
jgi:GDP-L-fucose synthase